MVSGIQTADTRELLYCLIHHLGVRLHPQHNPIHSSSEQHSRYNSDVHNKCVLGILLPKRVLQFPPRDRPGIPSEEAKVGVIKLSTLID